MCSDSQCYVAALKFKTHVSLADWLTFQSYIYVLFNFQLAYILKNYTI